MGTFETLGTFRESEESAELSKFEGLEELGTEELEKLGQLENFEAIGEFEKFGIQGSLRGLDILDV